MSAGRRWLVRARRRAANGAHQPTAAALICRRVSPNVRCRSVASLVYAPIGLEPTWIWAPLSGRGAREAALVRPLYCRSVPPTVSQ